MSQCLLAAINNHQEKLQMGTLKISKLQIWPTVDKVWAPHAVVIGHLRFTMRWIKFPVSRSLKKEGISPISLTVASQLCIR